MSTKFKSDLLITPDVFNRHDFNETMEVFVDKNRPTVVDPSFVDVMYDAELSGGLEKKLYDRLTGLLVKNESGNAPSVDLFFTNKGEYDTFIALIFSRGTVVDSVRARAGKPWAITRKVKTNAGDEVTEVLSLSVHPFEHTDRGVNYYGVTVRARNIAPSEEKYNEWVYYLGGDFSTVLNQANSYVGSEGGEKGEELGPLERDGELPVQPTRVVHEMDEENVEIVKDALLNGDLAIVMTDAVAFAEVYSALANKLHHPAGIEHDIEHYNVNQGTVDKYVFDKFTTFDKTYYVLKGYTEAQV